MTEAPTPDRSKQTAERPQPGPGRDKEVPPGQGETQLKPKPPFSTGLTLPNGDPPSWMPWGVDDK